VSTSERGTSPVMETLIKLSIGYRSGKGKRQRLHREKGKKGGILPWGIDYRGGNGAPGLGGEKTREKMEVNPWTAKRRNLPFNERGKKRID